MPRLPGFERRLADTERRAPRRPSLVPPEMAEFLRGLSTQDLLRIERLAEVMMRDAPRQEINLELLRAVCDLPDPVP